MNLLFIFFFLYNFLFILKIIRVIWDFFIYRYLLNLVFFLKKNNFELSLKICLII